MTSGGPCIVIARGPNRGHSIALDRERLRIGRADDNDVVIREDLISRYHAEIVRKNTRCVISDLESRNGTFVNGQRVVSAVLLADQDTIRLGSDAVVLTFSDPGATRTSGLSVSRVAALFVDNDRREVWIKGEQLKPPLSADQFTLLSLFHERGDRICTRDQIAERLWPAVPDSAVSDEMIDALVSRLRRRLREVDPARDYIATVRGHGFRLTI